MSPPHLDSPCEYAPVPCDPGRRVLRAAARWAWAVVLALCVGGDLAAATCTWTGAGGDSNWATTANWGGTLPGTGDALVFAGSTQPTTNNNLAANTSFASITFSAGASAFTLGGNAIVLTGGITNSSSSTQTVNLAVALSGTVTVTATSNAVVLNGVLSGSGALVTAGASSVTVGTNNTYTGGTTINQATVNAAGTGLGTGLVTVASGATLAVTGGSGATARYFNVTPANVSNANPNIASLTTFQNHLNGVAMAAINVASTLNFGSTGSAFPSPYNSGATNFEAYYSASLTIGTAGTYTFNTSSDDGSMLWVDGALVVTNNAYQGLTTKTGSISLAAGVHDLVVGYFQGASLYGLNAQMSGAGNTTMVDISTANAAIAPTQLEVASLAGAGSVVLTSGGLVVGRDNTSTTFSGVISGAGGALAALTKIGTGTLTLTGTSTYTGPTRISAGTLQVDNGGTAGAIGAGAVYDFATLAFGRADAFSYGGTISGTGAVTMNGAGTLTLTATNTYTGPTTISSGTVDATGQELSTGAVTVAAGATLAVTGGSGLAARYFNVAPTARQLRQPDPAAGPSQRPGAGPRPTPPRP